MLKMSKKELKIINSIRIQAINQLHNNLQTATQAEKKDIEKEVLKLIFN